MSHLAILRHSVLGFVAGLIPLVPTAVMAATAQLPAQRETAQLGTAQLGTEQLGTEQWKTCETDFHTRSALNLAQANAGGQLLNYSSVSQAQTDQASNKQAPNNQAQTTNFLVMGGGGAPSYNEIALEKNVLYFQRTLQALGFNPASTATYFANGSDGQATVRYLNGSRELFKAPEIPYLAGSSTRTNFQSWMQRAVQATVQQPIFFYFTGHGYRNRADMDNNAMILWGEDLLSVQQFATTLDQLPVSTPVVSMMAQCYSGSFANLIYQGGNPNNPVALHTRCGFFATVKTRPSVGCTPEVNEADYRDYSSSFFAGLSGRDRTGNLVASADYNRDGTVSYAEAHAFAKVDEQSTDLPVSTLEVWLQQQAEPIQQQMLNQPIATLTASARPEQKYVVESLARQFGFDLQQSYFTRAKSFSRLDPNQDAFVKRLGMELINIGMEQQLRQSRDSARLAVLERLIRCEAGSWTR